MGEVTGFLKWSRVGPTRRPVPVRLRDWHEVYEPFPEEELRHQAGRCMDCGIPFCNNGCPLGQPHPRLERPRVPRTAGARRSSGCTRRTTSPSSPVGCAPRRARPRACSASTAIRSRSSRSRSRSSTAPGHEGWVEAQPPAFLTGKSVAVVGSGPAGLAAAQQLTRAGHASSSSSAPTASAGCCATASPSSRWRSDSSSAGSRR